LVLSITKRSLAVAAVRMHGSWTALAAAPALVAPSRVTVRSATLALDRRAVDAWLDEEAD
jgi:hypothetical protein